MHGVTKGGMKETWRCSKSTSLVRNGNIVLVFLYKVRFIIQIRIYLFFNFLQKCKGRIFKLNTGEIGIVHDHAFACVSRTKIF